MPLPEKLPTALCWPPSPLPLMPMISPLNDGALLVPPLRGVMPGSSFRSSAVDRPTIGMFWICSAVRRALFSPESIGAISGRDTTDTVSERLPTFRAMPVT